MGGPLPRGPMGGLMGGEMPPAMMAAFSRATGKFVDITGPDDDLPWGQVRKALTDVGYRGWATAEVKGGDVARLTTVRKQMQKAFGLA